MDTATRGADIVIGDRIHQMMWRQKINQTTLSSRMGLHQTALSKKLRGERGWSADELILVARELKTTVGELFGETTPRNDDPWRARRDSNPQPSDPKVRPLRASLRAVTDAETRAA